MGWIVSIMIFYSDALALSNHEGCYAIKQSD